MELKVIIRREKETNFIMFFFPAEQACPGRISYYCGEHGEATIPFFNEGTEPVTVTADILHILGRYKFLYRIDEPFYIVDSLAS